MNFFSKSAKKPKKDPSTTDLDEESPSRSPSPTKKSFFRSNSARDETLQPGSGSSRNNSSPTRPQSFSSPFDLTSHPLNLPPEQLRRLSALSNMTEQPLIDVAVAEQGLEPGLEPQNNIPTPPAQSAQPAQPSLPSTITIPSVDEVDVATEGKAPTPPPHKSAPTSPAAPPAPTVEDAEAFKVSGNKYYKIRDFKRATAKYTKALEIVPTSWVYLNNRAASLVSDGQYIAALNDSLRADELDPNNPKILLRLGRIYASLGRAEEALSTFSKIHPPASETDLAPSRTMLQHISVAEDALKNGTTGSMALHALDQAQSFMGHGAPKPRKWLLLRGEAYLRIGNVNSLGEAYSVATTLLRINKSDPEAIVLRGRTLYAQGDLQKAILHFRRALECDPDFRDAAQYHRVAQKLARLKEEGNVEYNHCRWQSAVDKYTEALEVDPLNKGTNAKVLQNRALSRIRLKDCKGAIADCDRALALDPTYTKARKTRATALSTSGDYEAAIKELKSLQRQDRGDAWIAREIKKAELELRKSKRKNYYKILGIEKTANELEVKKAYRKLAIIHHPDKNPDDLQAVERFKDIGEAYETLSDPEKRARYDAGTEVDDPVDWFGEAAGIDPETVFHMMNGGRPMGGAQGFGSHHFHKQGGFPFA